jgi:hypothetical protein
MSFLSWLRGVGAAVWTFFLPLLKSQIAELVADPDVRRLAKLAVEMAASGDFKTGDEKHLAAVLDFRAQCAAKGKQVGLGIAASIIEAAYQKFKTEGHPV